MESSKITIQSKIVLIVAGLLFFFSLMYPMWQIELSAPQYPEGLVLKLSANEIGGDVDIINGLNHYIGMKTLHTDDFFEFKILTYILIFFGVFALLSAFIGKRKLVVILLIVLFLFVVLAGIDFYRWNYEYGHNLDPNAAIRVPGMSYQPPLIGYKQLLNFGAYSVPDIGGWLLITAGAMIFAVVTLETKFYNRLFKKKSKITAVLMLGLVLSSCSDFEAKTIELNKDKCDHCQMAISNGRFGAELITNKGRVYKFDDLICMKSYLNEKGSDSFKALYVNDYTQKNKLIDAKKALYVNSESLNSPMLGNTAAFENEEKANNFAEESNSEVVSWESIINL